MSQVKFEYRDPKDLIPYVNNTRTHSDEQITTLASMIAEFGFDVPIVVDSNNVIIKGHGRRLASLKLALKQVPVIVRDDLQPIEVKAARVADNRAGELSGWDNELLKIEFESLQLNDYNLDFTGFNSNDLSGLLAGFSDGEENDEYVPDFDPVDASTQPRLDQLKPITCPSCGHEFQKDG